METIGLTDPEWQRMDGAVSTEPAAIDPRGADPTDGLESSAGQVPPTASFLREHAGSLAGSVLFVGGLLWLLQQGALPVVPPAGAWTGVRGWAVALYLVAFVVVHLLRCVRWGLLIAEGAGAIEASTWLLLYPALFFVVTLAALNFFGDGLRDAFDPKDR